MDSSNSPCCRICFEVTGDFVSPCACRGTTAYVHEACLQQWHKCKGYPSNLQCATCKQAFFGEAAVSLARMNVVRLENPQPADTGDLCQRESELGSLDTGEVTAEEEFAMSGSSGQQERGEADAGAWTATSKDATRETELAAALNTLALLLNRQGRPEEARPLYERSQHLRARIHGTLHPDFATSLNNLAALLYTMGSFEEALPLFERSLWIRAESLGPFHADTAESLNNLAVVLNHRGQFGLAEVYYQQSLAIRQHVLGPFHPDVATSLNNLAALLSSLGRVEEAAVLYGQALRIREQVLGPDHPDVAVSLNNTGELYRSQGMLAEAELLFKRSLIIRERVLGSDNPRLTSILNSLASLVQQQGKHKEAEELFSRVSAIEEKTRTSALDLHPGRKNTNTIHGARKQSKHTTPQAESLHVAATCI